MPNRFHLKLTRERAVSVINGDFCEMYVVGILGGIASGKSTVTRLLAAMGAIVLDVDTIAHDVLRQDEVKDALRERWGKTVFDSAGEIDRHKLAQLVFEQTGQGKEDLQFLEGISHPRVTRELSRLFEEYASRDVVIVLDAAVMLKAGWEKFCDSILFVDADEQTRLERAKKRGWSREEFIDREANQESLEHKSTFADLVIKNGSDLADTQSQLETFWQSIQ